MNAPARVAAWLGRVALTVAVAGLAAGVAGSLLPRVPVVGVAVGFVAPVLSVVVLAAASAGFVAFVMWWLHRQRLFLALTVIAALTVAGGSFIVARQVGAASAAGVDVDLVETLRVFDAAAVAAVTPDDTAVYTEFDGEPVALDVYRPRRAGPAPVLVFVHGGGWVAGDRSAHRTDLRWFADQGWLVVSVDYALSSADRHLWDVVPGQIGCALTWVAANAGRYGGDASRLSLTGDSAGGNLAINVAYAIAGGTLRPSCGGAPPPVGAVSVLYPAVDPARVYANTDPVFGQSARDLATAYLGGPPDQYPERYAAVASATHVGPSAPPTLLLLGAVDHLVPIDGALAFADRARDAGVGVEVVTIPYADHVFDGREGTIGQQTYRQLTAAWLRTHGQG